ncbi:Cyclin-P3-1 [Porphyridium purpureum]|uniref:Cyclin-P3-1 n=1 Tax=Porphyridium purpureum TaxID=35688 RepID=A0A5J4YW36_PORPP|nr:Cyclin-P3-1 [Porphyridium purpureum]|eukprot:POR0363..scf227_4
MGECMKSNVKKPARRGASALGGSASGSGLAAAASTWSGSALQVVPLGRERQRHLHDDLALLQRVVASISILDYVSRVVQFMSCSPSCFVLSLIYLNRIQLRVFGPDAERCGITGTELLNDRNVHRLLITAIVIAAKFSDDIYYQNSFYAKVGGISVGELNALEREMLSLLNFRLYVDLDEYEAFEASLLAGIADAPTMGPILELQNLLLHFGYFTVGKMASHAAGGDQKVLACGADARLVARIS